MSAWAERRIETPTGGDQGRIDDSQDEVARLDLKIDALTMALVKSCPRRGFGL